ncbi:helix-turn-helix domain-containing protein [Clostridium sporogenes]|uniref:helix-turn-helix domain-containing protein n=1 Tax=Clostridium sporogenes TaxID=1509 RepID=UPI0005EE3C9A|nr:AraC family transcriptional regulator [Clostridium sporogenes]MBA4508591.1 helix-turn-helix transcriptional regulator [Clostridium sporogenes]MDU6336614.1 AraC family transcriptional regulator [Clostridium sporogenes]NFQ84754.1 helix-turn-helix transcriptional regulator [Clostridium sporogenes]
MCDANKHICSVAEKFFLCTNIPIKSFSYKGDLINSRGYNYMFEDLFDTNNIYEKLNKDSMTKNGYCTIGTKVLSNVNFTAFYICPKSIHRGVYIIGPYSSSKRNNNAIPYKPLSCIPHLISLLRNIALDSRYIKEKVLTCKAPNNLHIRKAMDLLDANYSDDITLGDISEYLNINKSYFCSILKKETGKTFSHLINEIRIEKSKELLAKNDLSILEIALSVGFNNQNYFSSTFKKFNNKTPIEFRNENFIVQ